MQQNPAIQHQPNNVKDLTHCSKVQNSIFIIFIVYNHCLHVDGSSQSQQTEEIESTMCFLMQLNAIELKDHQRIEVKLTNPRFGGTNGIKTLAPLSFANVFHPHADG